MNKQDMINRYEFLTDLIKKGLATDDQINECDDLITELNCYGDRDESNYDDGERNEFHMPNGETWHN